MSSELKEISRPKTAELPPLGLNPFCAHKGCPHRSTYQVGVMMLARAFNPNRSIPVPHMTTLTVCDEHKGIPKVGHLLTAEAKQHLARQMPAATLDFNTAKIVLKAIEGAK